jgi:hypothetical protein
MGFCRTGLFKRLESSGHAFLSSLERHVLRNFVYLHAIENGLPVPIGPQDTAALDSRFTDRDPELALSPVFLDEDEGEGRSPASEQPEGRTEEALREQPGRSTALPRARAAPLPRLRPSSLPDLARAAEDARALLGIRGCGDRDLGPTASSTPRRAARPPPRQGAGLRSSPTL